MPGAVAGASRPLVAAGKLLMSKTGIAGVLLAATGLAACVGPVLTGDGRALSMRSEEFAAWVEDVFRLQNEVLDRLAFALEAAPDDTRLLRLEDRVLAECAGLNALAVRRRDDGRRRPLRDARAARGVPACEAAANAAAEQLGADGS